jgi:hypothetical protein
VVPLSVRTIAHRSLTPGRPGDLPHVHAIQPLRRPHDGGALGLPAADLDDRAAGDDAVLFVPLYRLLSPDRTGWVGFTNYLWF